MTSHWQRKVSLGPPPGLVGLAGAADLFGVARDTVSRWWRDGRLPEPVLVRPGGAHGGPWWRPEQLLGVREGRRREGPVPPPDLGLGWVREAACAGRDPWLWDPDTWPTDHGHRVKLAAIAVGICTTCPVRVECGQHATEHGEFGVWGGEYHSGRVSSNRHPNGLPVWPAGVPHGTPYGARRHRRTGTPMCGECRDAEYEANLRRKETPR